jgi:hypothetical protein
MYAELKNFSFHCQKCLTEPESKPNSYNISCSSDFSEIRWCDKNPRSAFSTLYGCRTLFFFYQNIIDVGPDGFILADSKDNPIHVLKIYTKSSMEKVLNYQKKTQKFALENDGKTFENKGQIYKIVTNPILEVAQLGKRGCVATLSPFIPGENEYERYMNIIKKYAAEHKKDYLLNNFTSESFKNIVGKTVGRYIDPRNFKVNQQTNIVTITDIGCNITRDY